MVVIFHNEVMGNSYGRGKRDCHLVFGKYLTLRGSSFTDQDLHNLLIHDRRINCFKEAAGTTGTAKIKRNIKSNRDKKKYQTAASSPVPNGDVSTRIRFIKMISQWILIRSSRRNLMRKWLNREISLGKNVFRI